MLASELFRKIEKLIPLEIALEGDKVGFLGPDNPDEIYIKKVLILMDYLPQNELNFSKIIKKNDVNGKNEKILYPDYDLLITHHPPLFETKIPTYVIHSNWDILEGGACDALAEYLNIEVKQILDPKTRIGRIGIPLNGPVTLEELERLIKDKFGVNSLRTVKTFEFKKNPSKKINTIAIVSGFGLNSQFIEKAHTQGAEVYISGDLTHPGAILAKNMGINLIDITHHASEMPGLLKLAQLIEELGVSADVFDTQIPWNEHFKLSK